MLAGLVFLLAVRTGAAGLNTTEDEILVSSPGLRVTGGAPQVESEEARVQAVPRAARSTCCEVAARGDSERLPLATLSAAGDTDLEDSSSSGYPNEGRQMVKMNSMKKMRKMLKKMMPYMLVPGMMALGYAPFVIASLKMMVMNALMVNMMAFNAAIFITLRNMVFGPRVGQHVKYYNFGSKPSHSHHSHWDRVHHHLRRDRPHRPEWDKSVKSSIPISTNRK